MIGHYKRSKFMAEQVAMEAGRSGMHVVTVNPTTPIGEQDVKPTPTGRIVVDFLKRKFPAYVETGLNLVDVQRMRAGTSRGAGKRKVRRALHSWRRKSDAEADSRQAGQDHWLAIAQNQVALYFRLRNADWSTKRSPDGSCGGSLARRSIPCGWERKKCLPAPPRPSENWDGRSSRGQTHCGRQSSGFGQTDMSKIAIVAALEREVRPLVKDWRVYDKEARWAAISVF